MKTANKRGLLSNFNLNTSVNTTDNQNQNPFIEEYAFESPGPSHTEINFPDAQRNPLSVDTYIECLQQGAMQFAWFHEFEFESSDDIRFALRERTPEAIRRVLIAFLGGGTRREAAARVPISRSALYKLTRREIYFGGYLETWWKLGLIRGYDVPIVEVEMEFESMFQQSSPEDLPLICTMCHQIAGFVRMDERNFDCSIVNNFETISTLPGPHEEVVRGHLIAHFGLWDQPRANQSRPGLMGYMESVSKNRSAARRWGMSLDPTAITVAYDNRNKILPLVDGTQPTEMQMRRFYRKLIKGT